MLINSTRSVIQRRLPLALFLTGYAIYVTLTYRDFGVTWDESAPYRWGRLLADHWIVEPQPRLLERQHPADDASVYCWVYGGVLHLVIRTLDLTEGPANLHLLNFVFASVAFVASYECLLRASSSPWPALLGPIALALTPRFFGDIAANPKDIPFAVSYLTALALIFILRHRRREPFALLALGCSFGIAWSIRSPGFTLPIVAFAYYVGMALRSQRPEPAPSSLARTLWREMGAILVTSTIGTAIMLVVWPYVAAGPFQRLFEVLSIAARFPWPHDVLYLGQQIPAPELPWHYIPVWFLISTPPFVLLLVFVAPFVSHRITRDPLFRLLLLAIAVNILLLLAVRPVIYDAIRHLNYFTILFSFAAAVAAMVLCRETRFQIRKPFAGKLGAKLLLALASISALSIPVTYARLHPYEQVYFNFFTGGLRGASGAFELDYWGASHLEALHQLAAMIPPNEQHVRVYSTSTSLLLHAQPVPRIQPVDSPAEADYILCLNRGNRIASYPDHPIIATVERENVPFLYILEVPAH